LCNRFVDDPQYQRKLWADWRERKVAPAIEALIWHYAKGKPKDTFEHEGVITYRWLNPDEDEKWATTEADSPPAHMSGTSRGFLLILKGRAVS
jgi:hypothetical protein